MLITLNYVIITSHNARHTELCYKYKNIKSILLMIVKYE